LGVYAWLFLLGVVTVVGLWVVGPGVGGVGVVGPGVVGLGVVGPTVVTGGSGVGAKLTKYRK